MKKMVTFDKKELEKYADEMYKNIADVAFEVAMMEEDHKGSHFHEPSRYVRVFNGLDRTVTRLGELADKKYDYLDKDAYRDKAQIMMGCDSKVEAEAFKCYEIHTVQARMYGCDKQCAECREAELNWIS